MPLSRYLPYIAAHTCARRRPAFARSFGIRRLSGLAVSLSPPFFLSLRTFSPLFFPDNAYVALRLTGSSCLITKTLNVHHAECIVREIRELAEESNLLTEIKLSKLLTVILILYCLRDKKISTQHYIRNIFFYVATSQFNLPA